MGQINLAKNNVRLGPMLLGQISEAPILYQTVARSFNINIQICSSLDMRSLSSRMRLAVVSVYVVSFFLVSFLIFQSLQAPYLNQESPIPSIRCCCSPFFSHSFHISLNAVPPPITIYWYPWPPFSEPHPGHLLSLPCVHLSLFTYDYRLFQPTPH